jgi:hypothetical protein
MGSLLRRLNKQTNGFNNLKINTYLFFCNFDFAPFIFQESPFAYTRTHPSFTPTNLSKIFFHTFHKIDKSTEKSWKVLNRPAFY